MSEDETQSSVKRRSYDFPEIAKNHKSRRTKTRDWHTDSNSDNSNFEMTTYANVNISI